MDSLLSSPRCLRRSGRDARQRPRGGRQRGALAAAMLGTSTPDSRGVESLPRDADVGVCQPRSEEERERIGVSAGASSAACWARRDPDGPRVRVRGAGGEGVRGVGRANGRLGRPTAGRSTGSRTIVDVVTYEFENVRYPRRARSRFACRCSAARGACRVARRVGREDVLPRARDPNGARPTVESREDLDKASRDARLAGGVEDASFRLRRQRAARLRVPAPTRHGVGGLAGTRSCSRRS